jgi:hypothetical protein
MPLVLYYTYEIDVNKPNYNTPFSEIEGVLLQSQYRIAGVDMQFVATNVSSAPVKNEVFEIPPNCQQVSLTEMQDLVNKFNK